MVQTIAAEHVVTGVPGQNHEPGAVHVGAHGQIVGVSDRVAGDSQPLPGYLLPGFVDTHSHGGGGATVVGAGPDAVRRFAAAHLSHGTTTILASLVSAPPQQLIEDVASLADLTEQGVIAGSHLEGPWIATNMRGAHDPRAVRAPSAAELERVLAAGRGTVRSVTLAPELDGGMAAIRRLREHGVVAAFGHSEADWETTREAIDAGCTVATHLFNQMLPVHHREPGPVPALLADPRVHVELVGDGVHLHPAVMAMVQRCIPADRVVLVTDAMAAAAAPDGRYPLGDLAVEVSEGVPRLVSTGALAGSTLTMDIAVRRAVRESGFTLSDAVQAACVTPARLLGRDDIGSIAVGRRADLVHLDEDLRLQHVWKDGRPVC